jgi:tetratricopeptide (TPR) repeat protein
LGKALKYLGQLKQVSKERDDLYAVGLFTGLVFTDMEYHKDAIIVYKALLNMNISSSTIYGNLGSLYSNLGNYDDAIACLRLAIQNDEKNPAPYNNLAKLYFDTYDFENAIDYALKALKINHKFRQSASMLAIIYSLKNDKDHAEKYYHIAISCGEDPSRLQRAIKHYQEKELLKNTTDNSDIDED